MPAIHCSRLRWLVLGLLGIALVGCSSAPKKSSWKSGNKTAGTSLQKIEVSADRREIVLYALGLLGVNYRFGGSNPEAGLDCSGMASFIYENAVGVKLPHNAAQIAKVSRSISRAQLQAGDFVFFNTMNRPYSHMGIYLGDNKFIHAPSTNSQVKVANLDMPYFASRFNGAGTVLR